MTASENPFPPSTQQKPRRCKTRGNGSKDQIRAARSEIYQQVREEFRPIWAEFYALQEAGGPIDAIDAARQAIIEARDATTAERQREAARALRESRQDAYQEMLARHREERGDLREDQAAGITRYDLLHQRPAAEPAREATFGPGMRENFSSAVQEIVTPVAAPRDELQPMAAAIEEVVPSQRMMEQAPRKDLAGGLAGGFLALADALADSISGSSPAPPDRMAGLREQDEAFEMMERNRQQAREEAEREAERSRERERDRER